MKVSIIILPSPVLGEPWSNFPLGVGYVAAATEAAGWDTTIVDLSDKDINSVNIEHADVFGLSVSTPQYLSAKKLAKRLKELYPKSIIVAGGPHTLVAEKDFVDDPDFDSVVIGEGEFVFPELVKAINAGKIFPRIYRPVPPPQLDLLPFPARHLQADFKDKALKIHQLLKGDYCEGGQTTIIASRGCPYKCSFCAPHPRKMRFRTVENVIAEIEDIIERFGIYQFKWQDDTFSFNKEWVLELCRQLRTKLPSTYHRAHTRVNLFDEEMAKEMYRSGFRVICFGIESLSQSLIDLNDKKITVEMIERSLRIAKDHDLKTVGLFLFGMPGETPETTKETKEGIYKNRKLLDYINMATMVPLIGTPMWNDPDKYNCEILNRDYAKLWIVGHDYNDDVLVKTKGISVETMVEMKRDIYSFLRELEYDRPEWK